MAEQVVRSHNELAAAVADMNIDLIYFGADIELDAGITIPANKTTLIFDGTYEGVTHRFTDMNSNQSGSTLNIAAASSISLTFRNMDMTGRNYYGIPYIIDNGTAGVTVTYRDITYIGPQLAFNSLGLTRFENTDINISPSDASRAEEVGEVCRVEFSGINNITHNSTTDAVFWFRGTAGTAYFRLLPNASLTITTQNYFMYNYIVLVSYPVAYEIQAGARFILNSNHGFSYDSAHTASSFLVDTNAVFRYVQAAANGSFASLYITGSFTVNQNATVYMQANYTGAQPLLDFPSGTGLSLSLNNPKSFVLYSSTSAPAATAFLVTRAYSITAEQLNHWTSALAFPAAGTFSDIPQNPWHNFNWVPFTVSGNISQTSTTASSSGLINPQTPITNFSYQSARVISAGSITIEPDPIIDNGRPITGLTEPNANLIISFTIDTAPYYFTLSAGEDGRFELDPETSIPIDTPISISANTPFLIKTIEAVTVSTGSISIQRAPERIMFKPPPVSTNPLLLRRSNPQDSVDIYDSRPYPTAWELSASISGPLETVDKDILKNAVVFKGDDETLLDLSPTPTLLYTGVPFTGTTYVSWPEDKGLLVRITHSVHSDIEYSTQLNWTLTSLENLGDSAL